MGPGEGQQEQGHQETGHACNEKDRVESPMRKRARQHKEPKDPALMEPPRLHSINAVNSVREWQLRMSAHTAMWTVGASGTRRARLRI